MNIKSLYKKVLGTGNQQKIIKGVFWSFLGTLISKGFVFIALFLVARILTVDEYGKLGLLQSYINTFTTFSLASFGVTATKYLALYAESDKEKASEIYSLTRLSVFFLAVAILVLSLVFNKQIGEYIVGNQNMSKEVLLCAFAIFFSSLNGLQTGALAGLENFKSISFVNMVNGILSLPLIMFSAYKFGIYGVVVSLVIINFSIWLCSAILLQRELNLKQIKFTIKGQKKHLETVYNFTLPSFISSMMLSPVVLICNSMLIKNHISGYYQLGIYNATFNFSQLATLLLGIVGQVIYPMAIKNFGKGNRKFDFINILLPYIIGIIICLPILTFPDVFSQLFGSKYNSSIMYNTTVIVVLFTLINAQKLGVARNFAAGNFMWFSVFSNGFWAVTAILFSFLLIKQGAIGRSIAFLVAYILNFVVFIPYFIKNKLVNKELLMTKYNLLIYLLIIGNVLTYYFHFNMFLRAFIMLMSFLFIAFIFKIWYLKFLEKNGN